MPDEKPSLSRHRLPLDSLAELACGEGGPATLELLLGAERSRRLLLLRMLDDATDLEPGWDLLSAAQHRAPDVVDDVLMYPQTGMWLVTALRRIRGTAPQDGPPLWVVLGHLSCLAAAAGLRAGLDFAVEVPARHGWVVLPTLGCAVLPSSEPWTRAVVRSEGGTARVEAGGTAVPLPLPHGSRAPGWHPQRRLGIGPAEQRWTMVLDDLDPYRTYPRQTEPRPLSEDAAQQWEHRLEEAWAVLQRDRPGTAAAMRRGLLSLTPTPARERFRPRSVTSGDAFGGVEASEPDDAVQLAVTLVHEFQHTKLGGLLHLTPLVTEEPDGPPELWYAPWRDDPRPLDGLLQGIYAFFGIAGFWRSHRGAAGRHSALAHFEFALWREQVATALAQVHDHPRLTPVGRTVLGSLHDHCARWLAEPVPEEQAAAARLCAAEHAARWRVHHLRPAPSAVAEAVDAWLAGESAPPRSLTAEPEIVPAPSARWLDSLAMLFRQRLAGADDGRPVREEPEKAAARVTGALTGDALLASGDATAARRAYLGHLAREPERAAAWTGLGQALAATGTHPPAARLLRERPEQARMLHQAVTEATGTPPDPLHLSTWLAAHPT